MSKCLGQIPAGTDVGTASVAAGVENYGQALP